MGWTQKKSTKRQQVRKEKQATRREGEQMALQQYNGTRAHSTPDIPLTWKICLNKIVEMLIKKFITSPLWPLIQKIVLMLPLHVFGCQHRAIRFVQVVSRPHTSFKVYTLFTLFLALLFLIFSLRRHFSQVSRVYWKVSNGTVRPE